jgi:anaerobic ribonucleoside-triphosphate reductase
MKSSQLNASSKTLLELKDSERQKCEVWSRVMGYFRPSSHYNIGKKQEFADRVNFKEPKEI